MKLKTKVQSAAATAVESFIDKARAAAPFGKVPWEAVCWEVEGKSRAASSHKGGKIWFTSEFVQKTTLANAVQFDQPYGDFVRAYVCHMESRAKKGLATAYHNTIVRAFRYLYHAAKNAVRNPWEVLPWHFDSAINACQAKEQRGTAYRVGNALEAIAKKMDDGRLCAVRLNWTNPVPREAVDGGLQNTRVGKEFVDRRNKMLPSERLLVALGRISSRHDLDDRDLVRQRVVDLLVCGGFRIIEVLTLPRNCWLEEPQLDDYGQPMVGQNGLPVVRYGIRYVPAKGGHEKTRIKWLPTVMVDVAKRAIDDIARLSKPFRDVACFMAKNPGRTLLPEPFHSMPDDHLLTLEEVYAAVGLTGQNVRQSARQFAENAKLTVVALPSIGKKKNEAVTKWELERCLIERSGESAVFPEGQEHYPLHECLLVFGVSYFRSGSGTLNGTATIMTDGQMYDYIVGRPTMNIHPIFERLGYRDEDGGVLRVRSHQFRHWLDTMAEAGGMSQLEIALWFGRKDIGQNAAYNHMSGVDLAASIREKRSKGLVKGPVTEAALKIRDPRRKSEFIVSSSVTAHMTGIGVCEHNWAALPCPNHRGCITCDEHLIKKGDPDHIAETQEIKKHSEMSIALAMQEVGDGTAGANNWLEHHKLVLARCEAALAVHADDSIPDGTLVQLPSIGKVGDGDE